MICGRHYHPCHQAPPPEKMIGPRVSFLSKLLRQVFNEALAEQGLFSGQHDIVFYLIDNEGATVGELARELNVSSASASVSVKRMEKSGFITKSADENDARVIRLYPTEKACAAPKNIKEHMDSIETVLVKDMTEEEAVSLSALLQKAINNMIDRGKVNG